MDFENSTYEQREQALKEFEKIVNGEILTFYGAVGYEFRLNDIFWEAIEDPNDGYRSSLGCIVKKEPVFKKQLQIPLAPVKVVKIDYRDDDDFDGWAIVDIFDGHE